MDQQELLIDAVLKPRTPATLPADTVQDSPPHKSELKLLRESEARFRQLAENINEVFWITSVPSRQFIYVSPAYERIWGRSCSSLCEDSNALLETVMTEDRSRVATALSEQSLLPQTEFEYRILRPDNSMRWIRTRTFPIQSEDQSATRAVGVSEDITDRKVAEKAILEISARERRRIGQDLHDSLLQRLTGIAYLNKVLQQRLANDANKDAKDAIYIGELLQESIQETRNLARGLNPVQLDAMGLMAALRELARSMEKLYVVPCVFQCEGGIKIHDHDAATHLYRIAQEALSNAIKHGRPTKITVSLTEDSGLFTLQVRDDGKGFPLIVPLDTGMGLHIMNFRARMIGATLTVQREAGGGTLVNCSYPNHA